MGNLSTGTDKNATEGIKITFKPKLFAVMKKLSIKPLLQVCVEVTFARGDYNKFVNDMARGNYKLYRFELTEQDAKALFGEMIYRISRGATSQRGIHGWEYKWFLSIPKMGMHPLLTKTKEGVYILEVNTARV